MANTFSGEINNIQAALKLLVIAGVAFRCILICINGDGQPMDALLSKCKRIVIAGILILTLPDLVSTLQNTFLKSTSDNAAIHNSTLFLGGEQLLRAAISACIAIDVVWTTVDIIKGLLLYMKSSEAARPEIVSRIEKSFIIGIFMLSGMSLVQVVMNYFK